MDVENWSETVLIHFFTRSLKFLLLVVPSCCFEIGSIQFTGWLREQLTFIQTFTFAQASHECS